MSPLVTWIMGQGDRERVARHIPISLTTPGLHASRLYGTLYCMYQSATIEDYYLTHFINELVYLGSTRALDER